MGRRTRSLCGFAGAILAITGLALVPIYARSAAQNKAPSSSAGVQAPSTFAAQGERSSLPTVIRDPFVRPIVELTSRIERGQRDLHAVNKPSHDTHSPTVRAIVTGDEPRALLESGSATFIVGIGDQVGTAKVRAISDEAVTLDSGVRLQLEVAR